MAAHPKYQWIPTFLSEDEFNEFILPHLSSGSRGPSKKLSYYKLFSYIMRILSTGMKWEDLEIAKDDAGAREIPIPTFLEPFNVGLRKAALRDI